MPIPRDFLFRALILGLALVASPTAPAQTSWHLIWDDEFNGPTNSSPDPSKWTYDLGNNGGWGNQELETYTNLPENAHMDGNGNLVIHVESGSAGYFSARLKTQGLFAVQYGRIEARIKLPSGQGFWPAFWMLGSDIGSAGWPQCGEIDIMENIGKEPSVNHGSVHGPGYSGGKALTALYTLPNGQKFSDAFHTFSVQWSPQAVVFFVDGTSYETVIPTAAPAGDQWVFDNPFFLLLNVAVGGNFPGSPDATTQFPQDMLIDYVRVYQLAGGPAPALGTGSVVDAAAYLPAIAPGSLASVFGSGLAAVTSGDLFDPVSGQFAPALSGTSVLVNGVPAPLIYVSPNQINFEIPWETLTGTLLNVEVQRDNTLSNPVPVMPAPSAPSVFAVNGIAILTCPGVAPIAGSQCTIWGNGFGPTKPAQADGKPSDPAKPTPTLNQCSLTVGGLSAAVSYCGMSPGLVVYQLNFVYPSGAAGSSTTVPAEIIVAGSTGRFLLPVSP